MTGVQVLPPEDALELLPEGIIGFRATLGEGAPNSLFAWPRALGLALVAGALGDVSETLPADRELTIVEESLCEYLMQHLFANVLHETFPGSAHLPISVVGREPTPRWTRLFGPLEYLLCCSISIKGPTGDHTLHWLVSPQGPLEQLRRLGRIVEAAPEPIVAQQLEALVRELPVEVVVALGDAELSLSQLSALKPGDLLILQRRVSDPLPGLVDGQEKFKAWPGRVGSRQAIQVESLLG